MMIDWLDQMSGWLAGTDRTALMIFDAPERMQAYWPVVRDDLYEGGIPFARVTVMTTQNPFNLPACEEGAAVLAIGIGDLDVGMLEALMEIGSRPGCRMLRVRPTTATYSMSLDEMRALLGLPQGAVLQSMRQPDALSVEVEFAGLPVSGPVAITMSTAPGTGAAEVVAVEEVERDGKPSASGRKWEREKPTEPAPPTDTKKPRA